MGSTEIKTWYACDEHIEIVLDEIVDTHVQAPIMDVIEHPAAEAACFWCGGRPRYQLHIEIEGNETKNT